MCQWFDSTHHHKVLLENPYFVYILKSEKLNKYYIGSSSDPDKRILGHNSGKAIFTRKGIPWTLVYSEQFKSKKEALEREKYIKRMKSRIFVEGLIDNPVGTAS